MICLLEVSFSPVHDLPWMLNRERFKGRVRGCEYDQSRSSKSLGSKPHFDGDNSRLTTKVPGKHAIIVKIVVEQLGFHSGTSSVWVVLHPCLCRVEWWKRIRIMMISRITSHFWLLPLSTLLSHERLIAASSSQTHSPLLKPPIPYTSLDPPPAPSSSIFNQLPYPHTTAPPQ